MKIYFAGSIRGGRDDKELYLEIIKILQGYGSVLTEHVGNANLSNEGEKKISDIEIYKRDMKWVYDADVVVAEVTSPSLGVGFEIGKACGVIPVLCLFRKQGEKKLSAMLNGNDSLKVENYSSILELPAIFDDFFKNVTA